MKTKIETKTKWSLLKIIAKLKFRDKLMIALIAMSFLMALYMGVSFFEMSSSIIYDMGTKLSKKNAAFANSLIEQHLGNTFQNSTQIMRLDSLREVLKTARPDEVNYARRSQLESDINEIITYSSSVDNVVFGFINIYCKNGFNYSSSRSVKLPYDNYESCIRYYIDNGYIKEGYNAATWCDLVKNTNSLGHENYSFINLRILYNPSTFEEVGVMISAVEESNLREQYALYFNDALIMHKSGQIISSTDASLLGKSIKDTELYNKVTADLASEGTVSYNEDGKTRIVSFFKTKYIDAYFIIPFEYYNSGELSEAKDFGISSIIITLLGLLIAITVALWLSSGLYKSVKEVKNVVEKVQNGNLSARYSSTNQDEIAYLGNSFNTMLDNLNDNYQLQKEQETINKKLEIQLMQAQINPHLLYNSLNSALLALKKDNMDKAENLLTHLSSFFKISLSRGDDLIPLQSELNLIHNYIEIQRLARSKNFKLVVDVPDEILDMKIPKLTLQPIVENSILHGFSGYRDDGILQIHIHAGDVLLITVEDNGIGILEDELRQINELLNTYPPPSEIRSFGLYNVNRRIKNTFGTQYGIEVMSVVGEYTHVRITLPNNNVKEENKNV